MSRFNRAPRFDWGYLNVLALTVPVLWPLVGPAHLSSHDGFHHLLRLLDQDGRIWGQKDSVPGGGQLPTTSWVEGEIIQDQYELEASLDAPAGDYKLEIGMFTGKPDKGCLSSTLTESPREIGFC